MRVDLKEMTNESRIITVSMITKLMNYHRELNNAPKEYWQDNSQSEILLNNWISEGNIYNIIYNNLIIGFIYLKFGGQNVAWLEDLFIEEEYRCSGIGKLAIKNLDDIMFSRKIESMFVDIIPRNLRALKFYQECGFDHLNLIQLRKNYNTKLNKNEDINILGFDLKMY